MTSNEDLASMVKELSAHIRSVRPAPWVLPNEVPLSRQAIRGMANLRKLSIRGVAPTGSTTLQSSAALKDFILSFAFYCPTIKDLRLARLEFQCYYDLVVYVTAFRAVETLDLKSVTWSGGGPDPALDDGGSTYLGFGLTSVPTLQITLYRQDLPTWDFTVGSWGSSIQSLTIHIANQTREFRGLSTFSQLRHFELRMADDDIRTAPAALLHIKSEHIKTVRIVHEAQMRDMRGWLPTLYEWLCFDEILSEPPYTSLTRVTWCLLSNKPDAEGWFLDLPRCFSRLAERGILVCER
ncbi:hypothetical protein K466DRAFT_661604 [Polyporus arcularius HHB13444]|uniref:F-box domain-containing protein n=1 Tax=Polyporus arcularius HHB13444 TaxID=1314778 RepID=A0A5C3PKC6_9APHY|nr:hypothetical protein K466DRAFT_661604 [Polyporus arcularius HHB13444]